MTMKRFFKLSLILLIALLQPTIAAAHDFIKDGIYYKRLFNNEVEVTYMGKDYWSHGDRYQGDITIPETITYNHKTYTVTSLGDNAFYGCSDLTGISIPRLMSMGTDKSPSATSPPSSITC